MVGHLLATCFFAFMKEVVAKLQTDSHQSSKCDNIVFTCFKTILASWKFGIFDDWHTYHQFLLLLLNTFSDKYSRLFHFYCFPQETAVREERTVASSYCSLQPVCVASTERKKRNAS